MVTLADKVKQETLHSPPGRIMCAAHITGMLEQTPDKNYANRAAIKFFKHKLVLSVW